MPSRLMEGMRFVYLEIGWALPLACSSSKEMNNEQTLVSDDSRGFLFVPADWGIGDVGVMGGTAGNDHYGGQH